jgi:hypothetical protein
VPALKILSLSKSTKIRGICNIPVGKLEINIKKFGPEALNEDSMWVTLA